MNMFLQRYKELGQDIDPAKIKHRSSLRINTLKIRPNELIKILEKKKVKLKKIDFLDVGYDYKADFSLGSTPEYLQGLYYLQESASQVPPLILNPKKEDVILDCCAAPGSKTTQLAQMMGNKGTIIALDNNKKRLQSLNNNLERLGITNTITYQLDAKSAKQLGITFDKILVDAPCSGNFVTDKDWFKKRDMSGIRNNAEKQKNILTACIEVLKSGGTLVYSTCSLEPEEDEQVIEYALKNFKIKLEPIDMKMGDSGTTENTKLCRRFWPNKTGTQGFFIAKLRKK